jgi:hypothetical protein
MAISLGILCVLALAATGISFFALLCTRALATDVCRRVSDLESTMQSALRAKEGKPAELAAEARDRESQPPVTVLPARFRPGLNMTTRSQALRLHRSAENIAKVLEVPRQEVDLLLKVHGIVIKGI